jgi:hypothetical protein
VHKKEHHPEQPKISDSQLFKLPVEKFRQMEAHDEQYRERSKQIKVSGVGRQFSHGAQSFGMPSGTRGGAHIGYSEGLRCIKHSGNAELK